MAATNRCRFHILYRYKFRLRFGCRRWFCLRRNTHTCVKGQVLFFLWNTFWCWQGLNNLALRRKALRGYCPDRLRPLRELSIPHDSRSMSRCHGLFPCYSQWIPRFSDRIKPIASCKTFSLPLPAVEAFESLKKTIEGAVVTAIEEIIPFEVETNASKVVLIGV